MNKRVSPADVIALAVVFRFRFTFEKSSDEVEDVEDDRPIDPASKSIDLLASRLTLWEKIRHVASFRYAYRK